MMKVKYIDNQNDKLSEVLAERIKEYYKNYFNFYKSLKEEIDKETVHGFRTTGRRLISLLSLINGLENKKKIIKLQNEIKTQIKLFSPLRDFHIYKQKLIDLHQSENEIFNLISNTEKDIENFVISKTEKLNVKNTKKKIKKIRKKIDKQIQIDTYLIKENFESIELKVIKRLKICNDKNFESIHNVRKSFKKFRYACEHLFAVGLIQEPDFNKIKYFHDLMGDIQDNYVFINELQKYIGFDVINQNSLDYIMNYSTKKLNEHTLDFMEIKDDLLKTMSLFNRNYS